MEVMLDLETMSSASDAAIIAIGAVRFDIFSGTVRKGGTENGTFYQIVNLKSAQRVGGRIDPETIMWWLKQSEEARKALTEPESLPIEAVLKNFATWIREVPCTGIWGNGSDFDNVILNNSYQRLGQTAPWSYKMNRCYRTLQALNSQIPFARVGNYHNALDDAISQAGHLCSIVKHLNSKKV